MSDYTIALAGQYDRLSAKFVNWITHQKSHHYHVIGVSRTQYEGIHHLDWRTGSLMSPRDTDGMLEGVNALVIFCLTPPELSRTSEGLDMDVALVSAVNLAKCAQRRPDLRTILVMRNLPADEDEQMPIYAFWLEIKKIFEDRCTQLCVLETAPLLNEADAISLAIFERLGTFNPNADNMTNHRIRPVSMYQLFNAIEQALHSQEKTCKVHGLDSISWREWYETASNAISIRHKLKYTYQLRAMLKVEAQQRNRLLNESILIPDEIDEYTAHAAILKKILQFTNDMMDDDIPHTLHLKPKKTHNLKHTCYVQRLVAHSRRSVSETTDLLMLWLPRYFKRLVRVDELGMGRMACRVGVVPLLELEKIVESESQCKINIRFPWGKNTPTPTSLVLMTTGLGKDLRKLLIIVEDAPDSNAVITALRGMLMAFGLYLKEYG
ncbi:MAG: hypothetical protein J6A01_02900 [Proteobacteria bacterium]|nr:hypothetical protein [Pseudomonadota bacterium]